MLGLQYAERLPIGKEDIIQNIPAHKVLAFYKRWYRPENMAVIAVGDFPDPQAVVDLVHKHLSKCRAADDKGQPVPRFFFVFVSCVSAFPYSSCLLVSLLLLLLMLNEGEVVMSG